jgi:arylsulfatase
MNRIAILALIGLCMFALSSFFNASAQTQKKTQPNIIVIMCDDMGYSDIGCYGGEVDTPNLDALAAGGLRFRQFYNAARCCPTRASLLTGLYPHQAGIGKMVDTNQGDIGYEGYLTDRGVTVAEVLRDAGYHTRMVGKWHVSPHDRDNNKALRPESWPLQRGFDQYYGTIAGGGNYYYPKGFMVDNEEQEIENPDDFYYTEAISDNASDFIRETAETDKPLFMYVAYTAPHWPLHALPEDIKKYENRFNEGWDVLRAKRHQRMLDMGIVEAKWAMAPREPDAIAWSEAEDQAWEVTRMATYAAMIDRMDQGIGRIVSALKETGQFDNTLIMFLSDNGGSNENLKPTSGGSTKNAKDRGLAKEWAMQVGNIVSLNPGPKETFQSYAQPWANLSNTPFRRYKKYGHEGGISTPLVVSWPARISEGGTITNEMGHIIDLMPTSLDAAGVEAPSSYNGKAVLPIEGKSLVPIIETGKREGHDFLAWEHIGNRAIRQGQWKLVMQKGGEWELFDMEADRTELNDRSTEKPELAQALLNTWEEWAVRCLVKQAPEGNE